MDSHLTETVDPQEPTATPIRIFAPGTSIGERYEVREVLGMGGSGVVYAAYDRELRRDVALKVLRSDRTSDSALKRFRREVAVARDAHSPHLVRVFDIAQTSDCMYLTMELIEGESLRARLQRGALPIEEVIELSTQILTALDALNRLGIVHRDVKPGNILITREGVVKLADFGLARHVDRSETRATETEGVVGTFEYLAPEQALGEEIDARSDLYAFGIVLFEMLAGDVPYRSDSSIGTVIAHLRGDVPDVRKRRAEVPRWLAAIVHRLIERDRELRYARAEDVLRDVRAHRAPAFRVRVPIAIAASVMLAAIGFGVWAFAHYRSTRYDRLVPNGDFGVRALDRAGRVLWSHPTLNPAIRSAEAVIARGGPRVIAAILADPNKLEDSAALHRLSFLDPQSGREVSSVDLPSSAAYFPEFSDTFGVCSMKAVDIDHDGIDEIVVSYCQHPYYPTYTVFYDPNVNVAQTVFLGAGHHVLAGTIDVDGDGRDELILHGPSNRLGWYIGLAAVRVQPISSSPIRYATAATPDRHYSFTSRHALVWYALAGPGGFDPGSRVVVDRARRRISVTFDDGTGTTFDANGLTGNPTPALARARNAARGLAYEAMYAANRFAETGFTLQSLEKIDEAIAEADRAGDGPLGVWTRRVAVKLLIQAGRVDEAERRLRDVLGRFDTPADGCYDAATAFHLSGRLDHAYRWYREGLRRVRLPQRGRMSYEFLEGILFIHAERREWAEAHRAWQAYQSAGFDTNVAADRYGDWIEWRRSGRFRARMTTTQAMIDLYRYIALEAEAQLAPEADAATIREIDRASFSGAYQFLVKSLKAEILARHGDSANAIALASAAYDATRAARDKDPAARAHFDLVERRYRAIVVRSGKER